MARTLKTYTTPAGFFDLAVAAPSMKAALEAWGAGNNLFHQGFAKISEDPAIVAATMARPGVVLRRAVGTTGAFSEHADLPRNLPAGKAVRPAAKTPAKKAGPPAPAVDAKAAEKAARAAAAAFDKEQKRRDSERRREEAAAEKERQRRGQAVAAAQAALDQATQSHDEAIAGIEKERAALDRKAEAEDTSWRKKKQELETQLRRARSVS